jgi:predicted membrane protein
MEGDFSFNVERWRPEIDYAQHNNKGTLSVKQGRSHRGSFGNTKNRWRIRFHDDIPLDLRIDFGAGEGELDLSSFQLKNLMVDMGVGNLDLDLVGDYKEDFMVEIDGGVGSATLFLPEDIGVRVDIDGGLGSVDASGFMKRGDVYTNDAYKKSEVTIEIRVDAGIGSIDLVLR